MDPDATYWRLLWRSVIALCVCAVLVALCYVYVDRQVAIFVHDHGLSRQYPDLKWPTYPPPIVQTWTPVLLGALMVRRAWGPLSRWEVTLLAACLSLVIADQCKQTLKDVAGRYWPNTWIHDNPSFIRDGAYGFHPFQYGAAYDSFPSGHTARTLGFTAVVWVAYPRWRWLCVLVSALVAIGLIGMNYHFVGDVIAGGFVGAIVGVYAAHGFGLAKPPPLADGPPRPVESAPH
jgi:membrane-associated phospholipid phosphatase